MVRVTMRGLAMAQWASLVLMAGVSPENLSACADTTPLQLWGVREHHRKRSRRVIAPGYNLGYRAGELVKANRNF